MKNRGIFFASSLWLMVFLHADESVYKETLRKKLDSIFKDEKLKRTDLGVAVFSLSRKESLYELNATKALSPASTIKILTSYTALKRLGTDFTFKTQVLTDGKVQNGVLKGNLFLKGGGDPALVTERMYQIAEELTRNDFRSVSGDILVDDSIFSVAGDESRIIDTSSDRPYNAPVSGLSFNYNTTTVYFRPGAVPGAPVRVYPVPDTGFIQVSNRAKTVPGAGNAIGASRQNINGKEVLVVTGSLGVNAAEQRSYFNISQGPMYAGYALKMMLAEQGIQVGGTVKRSPVPSSAKKLVEFESLQLRELVILMNKFSNNFMADSVVKMLGLVSKGEPGTLQKGLDVLREESTALGINNEGFNLTSGSGLSRETRISSHAFMNIFNAIYQDFSVFPEMMSSLPIAAVDGTLRKRMKDSGAAKRLRGKTGTIQGVSTLVGVVQAKDGELLAYAVLMNDRAAENGSLKPWQNNLGQALSEFTR